LVLKQRPLEVVDPGAEQVLQLVVGHLPGLAAGQVPGQGLKAGPRAGEGVSRRGRVVSLHRALLSFFLSGSRLVCTFEPMEEEPALWRAGATRPARGGAA